MAEFQKIKIDTVTEVAYRHLRDLILTGYFLPGQWLRERELTELIGVSRTPIREALRTLEQDQLVIAESRRGFRIPVPTAKEIRDFYELRSELEGMAAAKAAQQGDAGRMAEILQALDTAQASLDHEEILQVIGLNNRFHDLVAMASGNQSLCDVLGKLRTKVNLFRVLSWSGRRERPGETLRQHRLIFAAIAEHSERRARSLAMDHILDSLPLVLAGLNAVQANH
ncbi:MAG: GntR family transcriptional regulator [Thermaerobacter sp.]|nr:GntR family transcriptional regulator [Thermaerobacter sp.]